VKKIIFMFGAAVALVCVGLFEGSVRAEEGARVIATYFHGDFRCPTCRKLEQYTKEAVDSNFKDALASGKLEFGVINVEEKGNEHYASDYRLYTKSLILSLVKDGKQIKWINLDKIWEYVGNKQKFMDYVKSGVADLLKEAE
jgi:hypothetical protein